MSPQHIETLKISQFDYELPEDRIAQNPLSVRDESKLLYYKNSKIADNYFKDLPALLPNSVQLIANNAKVIPARLHFYKSSGAKIELFLLEPIAPFTQIERALTVSDTAIWKCMIGNLKRWKDGETLRALLPGIATEVSVSLVSRENQWVEFKWNGGLAFGKILESIGKIPLPPYIKRAANPEDSVSYQTVFAKQEGAVAAPTAGLHFTPSVLSDLRNKQITTEEVTLYVGAGTFAPVMVDYMVNHVMHAEIISVSKHTINQLLNDRIKVAVGTTSLRTLETLYWIGVKLFRKEIEPLNIDKLYPYSFSQLPLDWQSSLMEILNYMEKNKLTDLVAETAIMIMPGYKFSSVNGLITNFHHAKTTLIMLIASFIGHDWQKIYSYALKNDYRFLSYGDSSLLWR